jgi:hypothetical protein
MAYPTNDSRSVGGDYGSAEVAAYLNWGLARAATRKDGRSVSVAFSYADGVVSAGKSRIVVSPVLEHAGPMRNKVAVAVRFDICLDGSDAPEQTYWAVSVDDSVQKACEQSVQDWFLAFGSPLFNALADQPPTVASGGFRVYAGAQGFRGTPGGEWLDGSHDMHHKVLAAISSVLPEVDGHFHALNIAVAVAPDGAAKGNCRVDAKQSAEVDSAMATLPWPRTDSGYMFKQCYVLR